MKDPLRTVRWRLDVQVPLSQQTIPRILHREWTSITHPPGEADRPPNDKLLSGWRNNGADKEAIRRHRCEYHK
ncbi:hypothetical protein TNCV_2564441 [Trichonephila clavipes]|nr:hypothetical protein TNCV_2564441 [Trichonephila clavipes]